MLIAGAACFVVLVIISVCLYIFRCNLFGTDCSTPSPSPSPSMTPSPSPSPSTALSPSPSPSTAPSPLIPSGNYGNTAGYYFAINADLISFNDGGGGNQTVYFHYTYNPSTGTISFTDSDGSFASFGVPSTLRFSSSTPPTISYNNAAGTVISYPKI